MNVKSLAKRLVSFGAVAGLAIVAGLSLMIGTPQKATAGTNFSIVISTNDFTVGYRTCSDGGYRYWNPGYYDRFHEWHGGYYTGQEVYFPAGDNSGPGYRDYHNDNSQGWSNNNDNRRGDHGWSNDNGGRHGHDDSRNNGDDDRH
jgi:hypothetical protein